MTEADRTVVVAERVAETVAAEVAAKVERLRVIEQERARLIAWLNRIMDASRADNGFTKAPGSPSAASVTVEGTIGPRPRAKRPGSLARAVVAVLDSATDKSMDLKNLAQSIPGRRPLKVRQAVYDLLRRPGSPIERVGSKGDGVYRLKPSAALRPARPEAPASAQAANPAA